MRKKQKIGIIVIALLILSFIALGFSGIDFTSLMIKANQWFYMKAGAPGIYLSTFALSIFGSFTVILPMPYLISIITILLVLPINPIVLSIFAALGSSIGELSAWLLGRSFAQVVDEETYENKIKGLEALIQKGYGFWLIFLFAATPLPDDLLLIALGMQKYSLKNTLVPAFIGKLLMVLSLAFTVFIAKNTIIGQLVLSVFGLSVTNGAVTSTGNTITSTIAMAVTTLVTIIIITVDWTKVWKRLKKKKD